MSSAATLAEALAGVSSCRKCALGDTRVNVVPGSGNPHARIMLVGEAPGKNEDLAGEPFVGAAGKRLNALLEQAGLRREDVYIANILKCRPPKNRNPKAAEVETCTLWLQAQIAAVSPRIAVPMGNFAARFMLGVGDPITSLRGNAYERDGLRIMPTFHPAAAIYDRSKGPVLEEDFRRIAQVLAELDGEGDAS